MPLLYRRPARTVKVLLAGSTPNEPPGEDMIRENRLTVGYPRRNRVPRVLSRCNWSEA